MKKDLIKILIILGLIIINLFFCSFSQIVLAVTYNETDNDKTLNKLNGNITSDTLDYLQYAAANTQDAFFEFDAGKMISQKKEINTTNSKYDNYETSNPAVICMSPGNHNWARTQRVDCIMDVNADGVTVYTQKYPEGKEHSRNTEDPDLKAAIELADQLAYFAYMSVKNNETTQNPPWNYYKSIMRFQIFGHHTKDFCEKLGIPEKFLPANNVSCAEDFYKEKKEEWKKAIKEYQYTGRFVFLNGELLANANNGQNDCIYSAQQKSKISLRIKKVDQDGKPLKGVEFRVYEVEDKNTRGKWLFTGVTNKNGGILFAGEKGKKYYVREYKTLSGYIKPDPDYQIVTLKEDKQIVKFVNELKTNLKIVKKDQDGNTVDGIKFKIYRVEKDGTKTPICARRTKNGGIINYKDAKVGETYYIKEDLEDSKKIGYESDGSKTSETIKIGEGENTVTFKNKFTGVKIFIVKQDSKTGKTLPGATFEIKDENGKVVATETTDDNGQISVLIGKEEVGKTYSVTEVEPPPKYKPSNEGSKQIRLQEGENKVVFKNDPKGTPGENPDPSEPTHTPADGQYAIQITKIDEEENKLENVGFKFTAQIEVSELDRIRYQSVPCTHYKDEWWYNEANKPMWEGEGYLAYDDYGNVIGVTEHPSDTKTINIYENRTYNYYLNSNGNWVKGSEDNAYIFKTDSNGVINLSGKMPVTTQYNINVNGDSKEVAGKFVGKIKAIEVESPYYGYKGQGKLEYNLSNGENKTITNESNLGNINIRKVDSQNDDYDLSGVEFKVAVTTNSSRYERKYLQLTNANGHVYSGEKLGSNATIDVLNNANGNKYHVEYVSSAEQATIFVTSKDGKISIKNVEMSSDEDNKYQYEFIEITNTNYGYRQEVENTYEVISKDSSEVTTIENEQKLGKLVIHKIDQRVWDAYKEEIGLEDVEFKIRMSDLGYLQLSDSNGVVKEIKGKAVIDEHNEAAEDGRYIVKCVSSKEEATTFITDKDGIIRIENLEVWKNPNEMYTYYMDEIAMGDIWKLYYDVKTEDEAKNDNTTLDDEGDTDKIIYNYQRYVDLSGFVWDDGHDGKSTVRDNEYIEGTSDRRVAKDDLGSGKYKGITVYLLKDKERIARAETDNNGAYFFPSQMNGTTSKYPEIKEVKSGGYKIVIEEISSYSIEFYYNGLKYASVDLPNNLQEYWNKAGSSKASDNSGSRNDINQRFSSIQGKDKRDDKNGTTGIADGKEKENNVNLRYTNGEHTSTLVGNTKYTGESLGLENSVNPTNSAIVMASTTDADYTIKFIPEMNRVRKTIENLNLGIYEKEQPDLAITTDLNNIKMTINGYSHTYNYQKRGDINYPKIEGDAGYDAALDVFSVKARQLYVDGYKNLSYVREIFPSYLAYTDTIDENDGNRLRVFVTYKVVVKNESSSLTNTFRLRNYCDSNYELYAVNNDTNAVNQWRKENGQQGGAKVYETNGYLELGQENCLEIYLTYEMTRDSLLNLMKKKNENGLQTKTNTTEIIAYTTSKEDAPYAGIDKDSAPDNSIYGTVDTYEDDIDSAPDLVIRKSKNQKTISGMVFEDKIVTSGTTSKDNTGEYIGNGQYENGENGVETVQVRLVDKDGNDVTLYKINNSERGEKLGNYMITENNGEYKFEGLVPGIYYLEYTYGRYDEHGNVQQEKKITKIDGTEVTTQDYKSTIVGNQNVRELISEYYANEYIWSYADEDVIKKIGSKEGYWYEGLNNESVAVDDYQHRLAINNELSDIYYKKKTDYDSRNEFEDVPNIYLMTARTPVMSIAIEDMDTNTSNTGNNTSGVDGNHDANGNVLPNEYNIKFGIVERPRQNFEVTKVVSYAKVILANGQVLIEGNPSDNEQLAKMNYTTYPENGKLKIEIDNEIIEGATLELTYDIAVTNLSDLNYDTFEYYSFGKTSNVVKTKIRLIDYLDNELSPKLDNTSYSKRKASDLKNEGLLDENTASNNNYNFIDSNDYVLELEPGVTGHQEIKASKLLSTAKDMTYDNIVEFLKVHNDVGRFYKGTPGNENFGDENENNLGTPTNLNEPDNNRNRPPAIVTIVPPTGQTRIYYAIGISCFLVLLVGIILIKKKVVDK